MIAGRINQVATVRARRRRKPPPTPSPPLPPSLPGRSGRTRREEREGNASGKRPPTHLADGSLTRTSMPPRKTTGNAEDGTNEPTPPRIFRRPKDGRIIYVFARRRPSEAPPTGRTPTQNRRITPIKEPIPQKRSPLAPPFFHHTPKGLEGFERELPEFPKEHHRLPPSRRDASAVDERGKQPRKGHQIRSRKRQRRELTKGTYASPKELRMGPPKGAFSEGVQCCLVSRAAFRARRSAKAGFAYAKGL